MALRCVPGVCVPGEEAGFFVLGGYFLIDGSSRQVGGGCVHVIRGQVRGGEVSSLLGSFTCCVFYLTITIHL